MARRCPPGVFCVENITFGFFALILIAIGIFVYVKYMNHGGGSRIHSQPLVTMSVSSSPSLFMEEGPGLDFGGGGPHVNQDVLMNPYVPPLRDNTVGSTQPTYDIRGAERVGLGVGVFNGSSRVTPVGMRVNVPTQSVDTTYRQVGILTRVNGNETILPLMGRPLFTNRDKWQFYTLSDKNNAIKLPVSVNGQSGTGEYGCNNVSNGDTVYVEGYNDAFKVTVYDSASVRYLPF